MLLLTHQFQSDLATSVKPKIMVLLTKVVACTAASVRQKHLGAKRTKDYPHSRSLRFVCFFVLTTLAREEVDKDGGCGYEEREVISLTDHPELLK